MLLVDEYGERNIVPHINAYLVAAEDIYIDNRSTPISHVPQMGIGNKPIDGGNYLFTEEEKNDFLKKEPQAEPYFKTWLGGEEFIKGKKRFCLWLADCSPAELRQMPECLKRIEAVKAFREASKSAPTRLLAEKPRRFHVENMPNGTYIAIPKVSSSRRSIIPMGFLTPDILSSDLMQLIPDASLYHFGVLTSSMHMAWVRVVAGRLKSDYRYSNKLVYNNFPWPTPTTQQEQEITALAQAVLDARALFPDCTLADLYDPLTMPDELRAAHRKLDAAVEKAYGRKFKDDSDRVAFLFEEYKRLSEK